MTKKNIENDSNGYGMQVTGKPSVDKPQNKFYRVEPIRSINTDQTIYNMIFESNKSNMQSIAIKYLGVQLSYEQLKIKVDKTADAFVKAGLVIGDCVLIGVSNCPESLVILLALNKIGAVSRWFDVRASEKDIEEYLSESKCKYLIIFDMLISKVEKIIDRTPLEKALVITPADSLSSIKRSGYMLKERVSLPTDRHFEFFRDFIKNGNEKADISCVSFKKDRPSIMVQSSGTTGKPKVIVHSDFSATSCVFSLTYSDLPIEKDKVLLDLLPPWIAYAIGEAILYPLALGCTVILCPTFDPDAIMPYLGEFTIAFAAPFHYRYLYDHFEGLSDGIKQAFYKSVDGLVSGGDKISVEENRNFEKKFRTVLVNGYGNNEGWGCLTVNPIFHNKYGSVGIAKYGETVIAYDNDSERELPFGFEGEICALANTAFLYYEGDKENTNFVKRLHPDGKMWLHTGDLGYVDEEGFTFLKGRLRRVITRLGFKISAYTIEDKITEHPAVKECVAVEVEDLEEEHVPMAFIVLNDSEVNKESVIKSILEKCKNELKEYEIPKYIRIVESLPYTQNGKYDFRLLESMGNEIIRKSDK